MLVRAVVDRIPRGYAVSHLSAASLAGVPFLGRWPDRVHLTSMGQDRRTTSATFVVHGDLDPVANGLLRFPSDDLLMTDLTRTATDLAMTLPFTDAVVALDRLLRKGVDRSQVLAGVDRRSPRGRRRARQSVLFADPLSDSVGESLGRVRLQEVGAPEPVLQHRFRQAGHPDIVVDFWFPEQGIVIEFDGEAKYRDPVILGGRSPEQAVIDEKYREDRLRAFPGVRAVVRLRWSDLWNPMAFRAKLVRAGLRLAR